MANCKTCKAEIAWKNVHRAPGDMRSPWERYEPERDGAGAIVYVSHRNGGGRSARRAKPSAVKHECKQPEGTNPFEGIEGVPEQGPYRNPDVPAPTPEPDTGFPTFKGVPIIPDPMPSFIPRSDAPPKTPPDSEIMARIARAEMKALLDEYGLEPPEREVVVVIRKGGAPERRAKADGPTHPAVDRLVGLIARATHSYLFGPAGSGKTYGARQAARLCGLESAVISMPGCSPTRLLGQPNAMGVYTETPFTRMYRNGGVVVLDELDRAIPSAATVLNSALENRVLALGEQVIEAHPSFVVVGTGNTDMRGATRTYTGAQPLDLATAARFAFVPWGYDEGHEKALVTAALPKGAVALLRWAVKFRWMLTDEKHDTVFCGPRETLRIAEELSNGVPLADAVESWVRRGLPSVTWDALLSRCPLPEVRMEHGK